MQRFEIVAGRVLPPASNPSQAYLRRYDGIERRSAVVNNGSGE
jgi:hypothetical protein